MTGAATCDGDVLRAVFSRAGSAYNDNMEVGRARLLVVAIVAACGSSHGSKPPDALGHTESTACAGQSIVHDQAGSTFRGVDSMEIFLR